MSDSISETCLISAYVNLIGMNHFVSSFMNVVYIYIIVF